MTEPVQSLIQVGDKNIASRVALIAQALIINDELSFEDCEKLFKGIRKIGEAYQWWIGDLLNYCEKSFGEIWSQLVDEFSASTLQNFMYVCRTFPPDVRNPALTFSHYSEVASLGPKDRDSLLAQAVEGNLSVRAIRDLKKALKGEGKEQKITIPAFQKTFKGLIDQVIDTWEKAEREQVKEWCWALIERL